MKASSLSFQAAVLFALVGMAWGIQMGASGNHAAFPAHAHLNLLGWVSLFLFGLFYHLHPSLDHARMALVQVWIWIAGIGALITFAGMLLFAWLVFRRERYAPAPGLAASPAK